MRVIGVVGASFCGSTVFGRVLSSLPGVIYPGEIHWLLDRHDIPLCYVCGYECPVYSAELEKAVNPANIYELVAEAEGGCEVLVSGDKALSHYRRYSRWPDLFVFLTREPLSHVASLARINSSEQSAAQAWRDWHLQTIEALHNQGSPVYHVVLERFLADTQGCVDWMRAQEKDILPEGLVCFPERKHNCGGNRFGAASLAIDERRPRRRRISSENQEDVLASVREAVSTIETQPWPSFRGAK